MDIFSKKKNNYTSQLLTLNHNKHIKELRKMLLAILLGIVFSLPNLSVAKSTVNDIEETYHVIVTSGTIVNKTSNRPLQRGMKISSKDQVEFKSSTAKAIVIGTKRGRFVLSARQSSANSELVAFVTEVLSPLKANSKLSTRNLETDVLYDFEEYFYGKKGDAKESGKVRDFVIIGNELSFQLVPTVPMNANNFLTIRYTYQGKVINKSIPFKGQRVTINKDELFTYKGVNIPVDAVSKVGLYYLQGFDRAKKERGKSEFLVEFKPVFIEEAEVIETIEALNDVYSQRKLKKDERLEKYHGFFWDVYGYTKMHALETFLKEKELL